jgi:hypothetical protein
MCYTPEKGKYSMSKSNLDPFSETYLEDVLQKSSKFKSVKDRLDFLQKNAITSETWNLFEKGVMAAYLKGLLLTPEKVKKLLSEEKEALLDNK